MTPHTFAWEVTLMRPYGHAAGSVVAANWTDAQAMVLRWLNVPESRVKELIIERTSR